MGKGAQKPDSSDQEEVLNNCNDLEKDCKWGNAGEKTQWLPTCLSAFSFAVVHSGSRLPQPDFSHVCPDAWLGFQGKCYYLSEAESNWTTSQESCEALGASLALINTMDELTFIKRYKGEANHWFGLRKEKDDSWWWTNGTAFNNWFEVRGGGPCAYLKRERISSSLCHTKENWLCSRPDNYILWKQKAYP
uniref:C-type lectin domain-containing protein n=1 Tax=Aquila chrysaetos chrysaetos TaxID=223781 RepID=A0A663F6I0_AQUCH